MLQPDGREGVALEPQAQGVVQTERDPVAEPAVERRLDGVVPLVEIRPLLCYRAVAAIRPQLIGRNSPCSRNGARGQGRILILRQEGGTVVGGVDRRCPAAVELVQQVIAVMPHVRDVERGRERQHPLDADVPLERRRNLGLVLPLLHVRRAREALSAVQVLQLGVPNGRLLGGRGVQYQGVDRVARRTVVEHAETTAEDRLLISEQIVRHAEPGRHREGRPHVGFLRHALTRQPKAVQRIAAVRHDEADGIPGVRSQELPCAGIHRLTLRAAAGVHTVGAARRVQHRRIRRVPVLQEQPRGLEQLVVLRLLVREPDAVVEGQALRGLPVVLDVTLDLVVEVAALDEPGLLGVLADDAQRSVRVAEAAVERVVRVVAEVHVPLEPGALILRLVAVVQVEPGLCGVPAHDLCQAECEVLRPVDVQPAGVLQVRRGVGNTVAPAEDRRQLNLAVHEIGGVVRFERAEPVVAGIDDAGSREDLREVAEPQGVLVRQRAHQDAAVVPAGQPVLRPAVGRLEEGRRIDVVVRRHRQGVNGREVVRDVVQAWHRTRDEPDGLPLG